MYSKLEEKRLSATHDMVPFDWSHILSMKQRNRDFVGSVGGLWLGHAAAQNALPPGGGSNPPVSKGGCSIFFHGARNLGTLVLDL